MAFKDATSLSLSLTHTHTLSLSLSKRPFSLSKRPRSLCLQSPRTLSSALGTPAQIARLPWPHLHRLQAEHSDQKPGKTWPAIWARVGQGLNRGKISPNLLRAKSRQFVSGANCAVARSPSRALIAATGS